MKKKCVFRNGVICGSWCTPEMHQNIARSKFHEEDLDRLSRIPLVGRIKELLDVCSFQADMLVAENQKYRRILKHEIQLECELRDLRASLVQEETWRDRAAVDFLCNLNRKSAWNIPIINTICDHTVYPFREGGYLVPDKKGNLHSFGSVYEVVEFLDEEFPLQDYYNSPDRKPTPKPEPYPPDDGKYHPTPRPTPCPTDTLTNPAVFDRITEWIFKRLP
jgi:hypothetical protein